MYEIRYQDAIRFSSSQIERYINAVKENIEKQLSSFSASYDLQKRQEEVLKHVTSAVNVLINVNQVGVDEISLNNIVELLSKGKELKLPVNVFVTGGSSFSNSKEKVNLLFNDKDMSKLKQIDELLVECNSSSLKFIEDENFPQRFWAYKDVENANAQIDNIVRFIKDNKMSPYEAAAFIHKSAQERFSYKNGEFDVLNVSCIVDITKQEQTICFGFAKYCKAIADKLCMPGLEYETFMSKLELTNSFEIAEELGFAFSPTGHVQNLVRIYDSKYDINGSYVSDACFDCKNSKYLMGKGFSSFMFSVEDLLNYKSLNFTQPYKSVESFIGGGDGEPAIVKYNKHNSRTIGYDKFIKCIKSIYSCLYKNETKGLIEKSIGDVLENSFKVASELFNEKSNNVFLEGVKVKDMYSSKEKTK